MKYFYDTEFLEDGETINFISIGIIREDGLEYYAVNKDADWGRIHQDEWLLKNVVSQLPPETDWKPKEQIRDEVKDFLLSDGTPELWAWFASYDHIVLAQLFGKMMDLPSGIPMYTHDLRSFLDYIAYTKVPAQESGNHDALADAKHLKRMYEYIFKVDNNKIL